MLGLLELLLRMLRLEKGRYSVMMACRSMYLEGYSDE